VLGLPRDADPSARVPFSQAGAPRAAA
jgi:hypothetical protein